MGEVLPEREGGIAGNLGEESSVHADDVRVLGLELEGGPGLLEGQAEVALSVGFIGGGTECQGAVMFDFSPCRLCEIGGGNGNPDDQESQSETGFRGQAGKTTMEVLWIGHARETRVERGRDGVWVVLVRLWRRGDLGRLDR